ncbi:MAG: hypothetical protein LBB68_03195 [Treponema sp.]|jgi:hypothetical protein|nr:hypothetical protein [Treponema sp.]
MREFIKRALQKLNKMTGEHIRELPYSAVAENLASLTTGEDIFPEKLLNTADAWKQRFRDPLPIMARRSCKCAHVPPWGAI